MRYFLGGSFEVTEARQPGANSIPAFEARTVSTNRISVSSLHLESYCIHGALQRSAFNLYIRDPTLTQHVAGEANARALQTTTYKFNDFLE